MLVVSLISNDKFTKGNIYQIRSFIRDEECVISAICKADNKEFELLHRDEFVILKCNQCININNLNSGVLHLDKKLDIIDRYYYKQYHLYKDKAHEIKFILDQFRNVMTPCEVTLCNRKIINTYYKYNAKVLQAKD